MTIERIKEIQAETDYPNSRSVLQALLKVWNECEQERVKNCSIPNVVGQSEQLPPKCIEGFDDDKFCDNSNECEWCKGLIRR